MPTYTISPIAGEYLLNSPGTALPGGWTPVGTVDLLYINRRSIATDICKTSGICGSVPITLDCSLACTAIGWPMQSGYIEIDLYQQPSACSGADLVRSVYTPQLYVSFGCQPTDPVVDGVWQGSAYLDGVALSSGGVDYGMTFKTCARMVVNVDGTLSVTVEINRIAPASDIFPAPPDGLNQVIPCGTITATLGWFYPSGSINTSRVYTYPGGTTPNQLIDFASTNPDCPLDVQSVMLTVVMNPFDVGCNGAAEGYQETDCSLDTGYRTYSCFSVLIKPTVEGDFAPVWLQLGVNDKPTSSNNGCYNGNNSGTGLSPPVLANMNPVPFSGYPTALELMNCGCTGEDPVNSDAQQIQYGSTNGAGGIMPGAPTGPTYEIVIKSVNHGPPCVAMRVYGTGNPWFVGTLTLNTAIFAETGHYVATATFTGLTGNPIAIIYGLQFPNGITASCVPEPAMDGSPVTMQAPVTAPVPTEIPVSKPGIPPDVMKRVQETKKKILMVRENPCVHLGEALETSPSCGCAGGIMHACGVHGKCRVSGSTIEMNCWRCPDYEGQSSA